MKECMLKMQRILLKKLAAEENRLKRLAENLDPLIANFDERIQKIKEVIQFMQY